MTHPTVNGRLFSSLARLFAMLLFASLHGALAMACLLLGSQTGSIAAFALGLVVAFLFLMKVASILTTPRKPGQD